MCDSFFFFKQKTAYEMRISDWSSDVCSSDLSGHWESLAVYEAHEQLLTALGRRWDDFREMPVDWTAHPQTRLCAQSIRRFVAEELAGEPLWAVKEPRLCRLLPLWPQALKGLPLRLTAVIMVRNPLDVAASLARRDGMA